MARVNEPGLGGSEVKDTPLMFIFRVDFGFTLIIIFFFWFTKYSFLFSPLTHPPERFIPRKMTTNVLSNTQPLGDLRRTRMEANQSQAQIEPVRHVVWGV